MKKKLIENLLVGGISLVLLIIFTFVDKNNKLGFFDRSQVESFSIIFKIVFILMLGFLALFVVSFFLGTILLLTKNFERTIIEEKMSEENEEANIDLIKNEDESILNEEILNQENEQIASEDYIQIENQQIQEDSISQDTIEESEKEIIDLNNKNTYKFLKKEWWKKQICELVNVTSIVPLMLAIFIAIDAFFISPVRVDGKSMNATLQNGDLLLTSHFNDKFDVGDIVIVDIERNRSLDDEYLIIKRVVAKEGDKIRTVKGTSGIVLVYVNDELISTNYVINAIEIPERVLKEGEFFCLGDNRSHSSDSRVYGIFTIDQYCGKVILSLSPFKTKIESNILE